MTLYIVRHAEAVTKEVDPSRPLSEQGRQDARRLGEMLRTLNVSPAEIWHSGKPRATQTAEEIAAAIGTTLLTMRPGLKPYDPVKPVARAIDGLQQPLMIVGHEPFLGRLVARLVVGRKSVAIVDLAKPGAVCLQREDASWCRWRLAWMLSPEIFASPEGPREAAGAEVASQPDAAGTQGAL
jgi:phosphohistidine phosphatase